MPRWLLALNLLLAGLAALFVVLLVRDLGAARHLPPAPAPRRAQPAAATAAETTTPGAPENLSGYNVIVAKYLFNASRSEGAATAATPAVPLPPKPLLLGVVVDGPQSRAYLEDPTTKRVFGYQLGDTIAGGRLEQIAEDRVVISRPDGRMDVLLRDPSRPKTAPTPPAAPAQAGAPPQQAAGAPGPARPIPPRVLRRAAPEQQQQSQQPQQEEPADK